MLLSGRNVGMPVPGAAALAQIPLFGPVGPLPISTCGPGCRMRPCSPVGGSWGSRCISKGIGAGRRARWKQLGGKQERWGLGGAGRASGGEGGWRGREDSPALPCGPQGADKQSACTHRKGATWANGQGEMWGAQGLWLGIRRRRLWSALVTDTLWP